jgi:hypothetical protein
MAHSTRVRMSISETRVRWTGHFSAISSSFERICALQWLGLAWDIKLSKAWVEPRVARL